MQYTVSTVRAKETRDGKKTAVVISVKSESGENKYTVNEGTYREIGCPLSGSIIDEDDLARLVERDTLYRARRSALRILSYSDNSIAALKRKLAHAGFERAVADRVCAEMVAHGYIDEQAQLERAVTSLSNGSLLGRYKIIARLLSRGYTAGAISRSIVALEERGEIDFKKSFERLLEKKLPGHPTEEEKQKLLYKYGYRKC